jgi:hypothetical protein
MRKNQFLSWSVEMHNWLVEKRSLFRVVNPGISVSPAGSQTFSGRAELVSATARWLIAGFGSIII